MSLYDRADLEEERRLFYVAVTRAKERLWVTFATSRYRFGSLVQNDPSRFIDEIPEEHLDKTFTGMGHRATGSTNAFGNMMNQSFEKVPSLKKLADKLQQQKTTSSSTTTYKPSADFKADNPTEMETGMQVEHQKFGIGKILNMEGGVQNKIATIDFGAAHGQKKIMLNYAKLRIIR
jgi:DNA helicase-2/ATP-dependent DNA helicase PcrA